jgi:hypothetical protein
MPRGDASKAKASKVTPRTLLDLRPWPVAWLKWPILAMVVGVFAVADEPTAFAVVLGLAVLLALWVGTFRVRVLVDDDGGARLKTRTRSIDLNALQSVSQSRSIGFPQVSLRAGRRIGLGGFGRWGPVKWNRLLDALDPYVRKCADVDPSARKLFKIKR